MSDDPKDFDKDKPYLLSDDDLVAMIEKEYNDSQSQPATDEIAKQKSWEALSRRIGEQKQQHEAEQAQKTKKKFLGPTLLAIAAALIVIVYLPSSPVTSPVNTAKSGGSKQSLGLLEQGDRITIMSPNPKFKHYLFLAISEANIKSTLSVIHEGDEELQINTTDLNMPDGIKRVCVIGAETAEELTSKRETIEDFWPNVELENCITK
ncbi:MAG: hypothetical protein HRU19_19540 [Pseudobacteriovorax sp.]|nr:hypothetical protein [Pseudobacteriovorax sp.]